MDIPSTRELELEVLLREKDAQLAEMTDEISALRQYLSRQPGPSTADPVTLPPALLSVLLPHINNTAQKTASNPSSTVNTALTQRARVLQEENDELYELLKHSETGKLKDEVRGLRRVVAKLEGALKDSHKAILSLSTELDKAYETILISSRQTGRSTKSHSHSYSPRDSYPSVPASDIAGNGNANTNKPPPTEPRAHKRPRLSEPQPPSPAAAPTRLAPSLPQKPQTYHHNSTGPSRSDHPRDQGKHSNDNGRNAKSNVKMEVDGDDRVSSPHNRDRDRNRDRERNNTNKDRDRERGVKERERPRDIGSGKDWDRDGNKNTHSRRNGHVNVSGSSHRGGGGGAPRQSKGNDRVNNSNTNTNTSDNASRTLQERLGL